MNSSSQNPAVLVVDAGEASYVHHAVGELRAALRSATGVAPRLCYEPPSEAASLVFAIGRAAIEKLKLPIDVGALAPQPQSYFIESFTLPEGGRAIAAAGDDAMGTNYAVMHLRRLLVDSSDHRLPATLRIRENPAYPIRGFYLHQHWRYNYPYATWSWTVEDWKRALDIVAHMRYNLVMIWAHIDMMAPPLAPAERDYLADLREVIDYAQRKRGLRVWLVEPANVLLDGEEVSRLPMEERNYYAYAHQDGGGLKNPADAGQRKALLENRATLYRCVPNADGYGFIDSDPGGWRGSPAEEFVDLLAANRDLLDALHERPGEATVFHWALAGWGNGTCEENWRDLMQGAVERIREPRAFLACFAHHVEISAELNHLPQTLLFPYGIVEGEPSFPITTLQFGQLQRACRFAAQHPGLGGLIGNVQTFLMQLPNIWYLAEAAWTGHPADENDSRILSSLASRLFPEKVELLVEAWRQLRRHGAQAARRMANDLEEIAETSTSRPGSIGRFVFPSPALILTDLAVLLRIHAHAESVRERFEAGASTHDIRDAVRDYLTGLLEWQQRNGYAGACGVGGEVLYDVFVYGDDCETIRAVCHEVFGEAGIGTVEEELVRKLMSCGFTGWIVKSMVGQLLETYSPKLGAFETALFKNLPPAAQTMPWTQNETVETSTHS